MYSIVTVGLLSILEYYWIAVSILFVIHHVIRTNLICTDCVCDEMFSVLGWPSVPGAARFELQ